MRNYRNRERDKLPVPFVHPVVPVVPAVLPPYVHRLIWCNQIMHAQLAAAESLLASYRRAMGHQP